MKKHINAKEIHVGLLHSEYAGTGELESAMNSFTFELKSCLKIKFVMRFKKPSQ